MELYIDCFYACCFLSKHSARVPVKFFRCRSMDGLLIHCVTLPYSFYQYLNKERCIGLQRELRHFPQIFSWYVWHNHFQHFNGAHRSASRSFVTDSIFAIRLLVQVHLNVQYFSLWYSYITSFWIHHQQFQSSSWKRSPAYKIELMQLNTLSDSVSFVISVFSAKAR